MCLTFLAFDIFLTFWHLFDILTSFWHFDIFVNLNYLSPSQGYFMWIASFHVALWLSTVYCTNKSLKQAFCSTYWTNIPLILFDLFCFSDAVICSCFNHFDIVFNYYVFILCFSFDLFNMKWNLNVYNFINNGQIFSPLVLLDLSQSPLCISIIIFNPFDIALNDYVFILCVSFDRFDMKWNLTEHVKHCFD